jgi:hypothetical protein
MIPLGVAKTVAKPRAANSPPKDLQNPDNYKK